MGEIMNKKRFKMGESDIQSEMTFIDTETNKIYWQEYFGEIVDLVNEQQATIDMQELKLQQLEEILELSENLNKSYREKLIEKIKEIDKLTKENEQLQKIGMMYQGHNPCSNCTYCFEDKVCCGINPPILCDEMKKDYFAYGLCKRHKQIQKSIRRYGD